MNSHFTTLVSLALVVVAMAFPRETAVDHLVPLPHATTSTSPAVTEDARLRCTDGSTILHTTDCTMGTPVSYCFKPEPQIKCASGYFPSIWHPDHCVEEQTCFPLTAAWIATDCSNGATPYSTSVLYDGTLAGGRSTVVASVSCECGIDQWYSMTMRQGRSQLDTFCMPYTSCPPGMETSTSVNKYCASATESAAVVACSDIAPVTNYCRCKDSMQTPVYPDEPGAAATGCEY